MQVVSDSWSDSWAKIVLALRVCLTAPVQSAGEMPVVHEAWSAARKEIMYQTAGPAGPSIPIKHGQVIDSAHSRMHGHGNMCFGRYGLRTQTASLVST